MTLRSRDIVAQAPMKGTEKCERFVVNGSYLSDAAEGLSVCVCVCVCCEPGVPILIMTSRYNPLDDTPHQIRARLQNSPHPSHYSIITDASPQPLSPNLQQISRLGWGGLISEGFGRRSSCAVAQ